MLIAIQDYYVYAIIGISGLLFLAAIFIFLSIKKNCPDAMTHWQAQRTGANICRVHYRGRSTVDYIAHVEKIEKEIGSPSWVVPTIGLKFKPESDSIHFIEGNIPCCDYYENIPKSIKVQVAVAYSQLKDYFKKIGIPIEGIEDLAFFIASEKETTGDPESALKDARINSGETKTMLRQFIKTLDMHKNALKNMQLQSGVFAWETAMNALDSTIAYSSAALTHTVETVKAAERRKEENKVGDYVKYGMFLFIAMIGLTAVYLVTK